MNQRVITAVAVAAVAVGALVALSDSDLGTAPQDSRRLRLAESKLVELPDGGKGYVLPADLEDGGVEYLTTDAAPCARRRPGLLGTCLRRSADGGTVDPGDYNRFPSSEAVGVGCEGVACSVVAGEDADESEDVRLERERQRRDGGTP